MFQNELKMFVPFRSCRLYLCDCTGPIASTSKKVRQSHLPRLSFQKKLHRGFYLQPMIWEISSRTFDILVPVFNFTDRIGQIHQSPETYGRCRQSYTKKYCYVCLIMQGALCSPLHDCEKARRRLIRALCSSTKLLHPLKEMAARVVRYKLHKRYQISAAFEPKLSKLLAIQRARIWGQKTIVVRYRKWWEMLG